MKSVHGMSEQLNLVTNWMDQMEEHVRPPMTVMENTRGKEKEMGSNKGQFSTQPSVNPRNISSVELQEFSLSEDSFDISPQGPCDSVHAITRLRSGKILETPIECDLEDKKKEIEEENEESENLGKDMNPAAYQPPIPFPEALKSSKPPSEANRLIDSFKEANITIPLEEAIRYIPTFSKYVKELCTPQRRTNRIKLPESVSSIILNKLPVKRKDPGPPLITCDIGGTQFSRSLLDSGVGVNLIPKALYDKYKFVELQPINVEL